MTYYKCLIITEREGNTRKRKMKSKKMYKHGERTESVQWYTLEEVSD